MIKLYTATSCISSRQARQWLEKQGLEYEEKNILTDSIEREEFIRILSLTEDGVADLISTRSNAYKNLTMDYENLSFEQLIKLLDKKRTLMKRPLIHDERRLQIGYNADDIRQFVPREIRNVQLQIEKVEIA